MFNNKEKSMYIIKRQKNLGFTLAETLLTVMILLLVSGILVTGIPMAKNAYEKVVVAANAQTMLSTAITSLRDELGTAWNVEIPSDNKSIEYYDAGTGAKSKIDFEEKAITITNYSKVNLIHDDDKGQHYKLLPDSDSSMYVAAYTANSTDKVVTIANNVITINQLGVFRKKDDALLASTPLKIGLLSESVENEGSADDGTE